MSKGCNYLHSHSAIEREKKFPKHIVLVDKEYKSMFAEGAISLEPYKYNWITYYKVPILSFVKKGGQFKNFDL